MISHIVLVQGRLAVCAILYSAPMLYLNWMVLLYPNAASKIVDSKRQSFYVYVNHEAPFHQCFPRSGYIGLVTTAHR
jgi:hypothetical protein